MALVLPRHKRKDERLLQDIRIIQAKLLGELL